MLHRVRAAIKSGSFDKMGGPDSGPIEIDETFIGANKRFMHADKKARFSKTSMVTAKPAMRGRLKTGHVKWPKTGVVLPCRSEFGKAGFGRAVTC
jgi:hypothetical protein